MWIIWHLTNLLFSVSCYYVADKVKAVNSSANRREKKETKILIQEARDVRTAAAIGDVTICLVHANWSENVFGKFLKPRRSQLNPLHLIWVNPAVDFLAVLQYPDMLISWYNFHALKPKSLCVAQEMEQEMRPTRFLLENWKL